MPSSGENPYFCRRSLFTLEMAKFHSLKVAEITRETDDCVSVVFEVPALLQQEYRYIHGQYLTLKLTVNGEELRRSYSVCSSPLADKELRIAVKKVKDGRGSTFVNDLLKAGDMVEVMTPMGNFYSPLRDDHQKHYVLFAGGSGITPMMSIIKSVLHAEPKSDITLFYGNRDEASIIFKKQIETIKAAVGERLRVFHILEHPAAGTADLYTGLLTTDKVHALLKAHVNMGTANEYFICGPGPMMENVKLVLTEQKVEKEKIHIEYFTAVAEAVKAAENTSATTGGTVKAKVTVILDDEETTMDLASDGMVVLDAALDAGLDVPFACKGAVCCTCRAKVLEGKVTMDMNYALSDDEVEQGYVLTCQSHPASEKVVISYDEP